MMAFSLFFGLFPSHFIRVIEGGVGPILAKIQGVTPVIARFGGG